MSYYPGGSVSSRDWTDLWSTGSFPMPTNPTVKMFASGRILRPDANKRWFWIWPSPSPSRRAEAHAPRNSYEVTMGFRHKKMYFALQKKQEMHLDKPAGRKVWPWPAIKSEIANIMDSMGLSSFKMWFRTWARMTAKCSSRAGQRPLVHTGL